MTDGRKQIVIYTDGACIGNPGPGGYGIVLRYGGRVRELAGGYQRTTNNRMELVAAIVGLEALKEPCQVTLISDSQYLVQAMTQGWVTRWQAHGWRRAKQGGPVANIDLWQRLTALCAVHDVTFTWVRGHAGDPDNERCDALSMQAASDCDLPVDAGYEERQAVPQATLWSPIPSRPCGQ